jgi:hypothetical protein
LAGGAAGFSFVGGRFVRTLAMSIFPWSRQTISVVALVASCPFLCCEALATTQVPFVGCASDGQLGPVAAPKGDAMAVNVDAALASRLAFYQAQDSFGVLAPRGWNCFYLYGSSGASLLVAPSGNLSIANSRLGGPGVVLTLDSGGTSGRFEVAKYAARLFAQQEEAFIASVIAEGIEPKKDFPSGPYPADKMTYRNPLLVEFATPANKDGLGTSDRLQKNALPVVGTAMLKATPNGPDFYLLTVRLPADQVDLAPAIIAQAE